MILFLDTSALIKRYIEEKGSKIVEKLTNEAQKIIISEITTLECLSAIRRMEIESRITKEEYIKIKDAIRYELEDVVKIQFDNQVSKKAEEMIEIYQLKTLDAIQLGTCIMQQDVIEGFVCCDTKLLNSAKTEGLKVINPLE